VKNQQLRSSSQWMDDPTVGCASDVNLQESFGKK